MGQTINGFPLFGEPRVFEIVVFLSGEFLGSCAIRRGFVLGLERADDGQAIVCQNAQPDFGASTLTSTAGESRRLAVDVAQLDGSFTHFRHGSKWGNTFRCEIAPKGPNKSGYPDANHPSPERATQVVLPQRVVPPFQGFATTAYRNPGRCPGLICLGPFGANFAWSPQMTESPLIYSCCVSIQNNKTISLARW